MKKLFIFLFTTVFFIQGCQKQNELETKKAELTEVKKEYSGLKEKIRDLEKEVAILEGTDTLQKGKAVAVQVITPADFSHYIEVQGKVESDKNIIISAEAAGTISKIYVREGQAVSQGQILAELDASIILTQIAEMKTRVEFARTMFEKRKKLWEQKVGTEVEYLNAKNQKEAAENGLTSLQRQYEKTKVKSPISGTLDMKKVKEGELVSPGLPMFRVINNSDVKIIAKLAESYLSRAKKGQEVLISFPDVQQEAKGVISVISQVVDPISRTFDVEVKLISKVDIRPNMVAVVKIRDYQNKSALVVPVNAIQATDEGEFVFIADKKNHQYRAERRLIKKGIAYSGKIEIVDGIEKGDQVVVVGHQDLVDQQAIKINN